MNINNFISIMTSAYKRCGVRKKSFPTGRGRKIHETTLNDDMEYKRANPVILLALGIIIGLLWEILRK